VGGIGVAAEARPVTGGTPPADLRRVLIARGPQSAASVQARGVFSALANLAENADQYLASSGFGES
jgi:hypothetical protein